MGAAVTLAPSWQAFWERVRAEPYRSSGKRAYPIGHVWVTEEFRAGVWRPIGGVWFVTRHEAWSRWTLERLRAAVIGYRRKNPRDRRRWGPWVHRRKHGPVRLAKYVRGRGVGAMFIVEVFHNGDTAGGTSRGWKPRGVWSGFMHATREGAIMARPDGWRSRVRSWVRL